MLSFLLILIIIFVVLTALFVMVYVNRCVAKIEGRNGTATAPSMTASVSRTSGAKDMKKIVAAISAAINASTGKSMNIIGITPVQGNTCPNMTPVWRAKGIAECIESRLGSRSW